MKKGDIDRVLSLISESFMKEKNTLNLTPTPLLLSTGKELGKMLIKEECSFSRLMDLWKKGRRDEKLIVIFALRELCKKDYENSKSFVINIVDDISDWEVCDQLAVRVVASLAVKNRDNMFSLMHNWIKSENKWARRLAAATLTAYVRKRKEDSGMCLQLLDEMMGEEDKDVKKAIGWALREITKKDSEAVFKFLQKWAKQDKNARSIVRDGMKKFAKGEAG
jgi:3-methyladenine DNA glycosylase AlkD